MDASLLLKTHRNVYRAARCGQAAAPHEPGDDPYFEAPRTVMMSDK
jgi:hypothetical protein